MKRSLRWKPAIELGAILIYTALLSNQSYGGAFQVLTDGTPKRWKANTPIPYVVNPGGVPGFTGELQRLVVVGAVNDAFRAWTEVPGAAISFTTSGTSSQPNAAADGTSLVTFTDTAVSFPPGVLAVALVASASGPGRIQFGNTVVNAEFAGQILDVDIVFNSRAAAFSPVGANNTIDLVSVGIHEVGHLLGLDHTGVFSSIMNPFSESGAGIASRALQTDDAITAASLYPAASFAADRGAISGTISLPDGTLIKSAHVVAVSNPGGVPVASQLSDGVGKFTLAGLPPGSYRVLVEPLDGPIGLGNFPGVFSSGLANFATTFFGGLLNPTPVSVAAGQTATANVTVSAKTPSTLNIDTLGTSTQTPAGTSFSFGASPLFLPRGKSYQVFVAATNATTDSNLIFSGAGITGQATSPGILPNGQPIRQQSISLSDSAALGPSNVSLSAGSVSFFPGGIVATVNPSIRATLPVVEGAGFTATLAPGTIFSIFGSDLAFGRGQGGTEGWLGPPAPTNLGGVSVKVGDRFAPLFFVSPGQINGLIPYETTGTSVPVTIVTGPNASGNTVTVTLSPTAPGIFTLGGGQGAILNGTDNTIASPGGTFPGSHPARPGDVVVIYGSGLGPVTPALPSGIGSAANGTAIPELSSPPRVLIGGQQATIRFAGLTPALVGLYQLNVVVPAGITAGSAVPVGITTAQGQTSNTVTMAVSP